MPTLVTHIFRESPGRKRLTAEKPRVDSREHRGKSPRPRQDCQHDDTGVLVQSIGISYSNMKMALSKIKSILGAQESARAFGNPTMVRIQSEWWASVLSPPYGLLPLSARHELALAVRFNVVHTSGGNM